MSLDARIVVRREQFRLTAEVAAAPGEVVAVAGPNGAGKSTLLQAVAGLLHVLDGKVVVAGRVVAHGTGVHTPSYARRIGWLSQESLLFPHLDAADNVGYGLRAAGVRRRAARARATRLLDTVGLAELARRRPHEVSGGQAARIALLRALATEPDVVLLDEPFAALDVGTAETVRSVAVSHLRGRATSTLLVTQNVTDALLLADRLLVLESGVVTDDRPVAEVLAEPRTAFAARFGGSNAVRAVVGPTGGLVTDDGAELGVRSVLAVGSPVSAFFPPDAVTVGPAGPGVAFAVATVATATTGAVITAAVDDSSTLRAEVPLGTTWLRGLRAGDPLRWAIEPRLVRIVAH